jgi:hypothetical protein
MDKKNAETGESYDGMNIVKGVIALKPGRKIFF